MTQSHGAVLRLSPERAFFKRIVVAWQDLDDGRAALNRLLGLNGDTPPPSGDTTVRQALVTSVIVAYGRLFAPSKSRGDVPGQLPGAFANGLTPEERKLHKRIIALRSKEFAHSDADIADLRITVRPEYMGGVLLPTSRRLRSHSVSDADLTAVDGLFTKVHVYLYEEMMRLYPRLAPYGDF